MFFSCPYVAFDTCLRFPTYDLVISTFPKPVFPLTIRCFLSFPAFSNVCCRNYDLSETCFSTNHTLLFELASLFPCTLPYFMLPTGAVHVIARMPTVIRAVHVIVRKQKRCCPLVLSKVPHEHSTTADSRSASGSASYITRSPHQSQHHGARNVATTPITASRRASVATAPVTASRRASVATAPTARKKRIPTLRWRPVLQCTRGDLNARPRA